MNKITFSVEGWEDYNGLIETLYICRHKNTCREIKEGANTPIEECIKMENVNW